MLLTLLGSILLALAIVIQKSIIKNNTNIISLLKNQKWLLTILLDILGFALYYIDLMKESISIIQPIFATVIIWTIIIESIITHKKLSPLKIAACILAFIGIVFMGIA